MSLKVNIREDEEDEEEEDEDDEDEEDDEDDDDLFPTMIKSPSLRPSIDPITISSSSGTSLPWKINFTFSIWNSSSNTALITAKLSSKDTSISVIFDESSVVNVIFIG